MALLLSTSAAIPAPKSANAYIGIETPQIAVPKSAYVGGSSFSTEAVEDMTFEKFEEMRSKPIPLTPEPVT